MNTEILNNKSVNTLTPKLIKNKPVKKSKVRKLGPCDPKSDLEIKVFLAVLKTLRNCKVGHCNITGLATVITNNILLEQVSFVPSKIKIEMYKGD
jgi:hypothetical protein